MAYPRTYVEARVATAVRLPVSVHRRLHVAADRGVSADLLITRAVTELLDRLTLAEAASSPKAGSLGRVVTEAAA
ncbi:MAG: hypothetical protein M1522_06060 [Actinobacteria bacterium]|nr:hypothetical protein [Actinomycetota bacterium]